MLLQYVINYDISQANATFMPTPLLTTQLNKAAYPNGSFPTFQDPPLQGTTTYFPPGRDPVVLLGKPVTRVEDYVAYLQRLVYLIETMALSDNTQCAFDTQG